ncbi:MAG: hypothetical protein RL885_11600 [Planctomycetota bacterium]
MRCPLHLVAEALDVGRGPSSTCCVCGDSPFPDGGKLGSNFADQGLLARPDVSSVCAGCSRILGGRPGDDPPPLRTVSVLVRDGVLQAVDRAQMWDLLAEPPEGPFLLSHAASRKKHHLLRAGLSISTHLLIGGDNCTIEYVPARDGVLLDAVQDLLSGEDGKPSFTRTSIAEGHYHASRAVDFGARRHALAETLIMPYRRGRPALLDLVLWCCPVKAATSERGDIDMQNLDDLRAAQLLGAIARGSSMRAGDGLAFWNGFFEHRVRRFARLPLADLVSRLMTEVGTPPASEGAQHAAAMLAGLNEDEERGVERAIRDRMTLVLTMAYDHRRIAS